MTQVALASGFASVRRFNAAFAEHYGLNPTRLRREARPSGPRADARDPAPRLSAAVRRRRRCSASSRTRACAGVEHVDGADPAPHAGAAASRRLLAGWLACRFVPERNEVLLDVAPSARAGARRRDRGARAHAFDLDADPALIEPALAGMPLASSAAAGTARARQRSTASSSRCAPCSASRSR